MSDGILLSLGSGRKQRPALIEFTSSSTPNNQLVVFYCPCCLRTDLISRYFKSRQKCTYCDVRKKQFNEHRCWRCKQVLQQNELSFATCNTCHDKLVSLEQQHYLFKQHNKYCKKLASGYISYDKWLKIDDGMF